MAFNLADLVRKFLRLKDGLTRKTFLITLLALGLVLYLGPNVFRWLRVRTPIMIDSNIGCVAQYMDPFIKKAAVSDATYHIGYGPNPTFLPYIGNGKLALPLLGEQTHLHVRHGRALSVSTDFNPIVQVRWMDYSHQDGTAVDYVTGLGHHYSCYNKRRRFFTVKTEFLADRSNPSLLVQKIELFNDLKEDIQVSLLQEKPAQSRPLGLTLEDGTKYRLSGLKLPLEGGGQLGVVVVVPDLPESLVLGAESSRTLYIRTIVHYGAPSSQPDADLKSAETSALNMLKKLHNTSYRDLRQKHIQTWSQLWNSGFGISHSKATGAINGDKINATLYYMAANSRTLLPAGSLQTVDRCYDGHHTLQASKLWSDLESVAAINKIVAHWFLTLDKQSCQHLLDSGAEGVMQAMILSFGALKFRNQHLEFNTHPDDLHRDYHFRRIGYGNGTHLNISVVVGQDNKAVIFAALDRQDKEYYGCDGGCLDPPVRLGPEVAQFPVKLTDPVTAILYITSDKEHMEDLKHAIHLKNVVEAPAHQQHILTLHRHGHQLGGLPAVFWVSIAFLIVVFHLFLAKLIYNEYFAAAQDRHPSYPRYRRHV